MRTIYLQSSLSINGRSALRGRRLVDRLREVSEDVLLGHLIAPEDFASRADPSIRRDVISEIELIKFAPDVIFVEGGLFAGSGLWRVNEKLGREFIQNGGTLIVADVDLNKLREQRVDYYEASGFLGATAAYCDDEPVAGYDEKSYWKGTKQILCDPEDMVLSEWLKPVFEGVPRILCGLPVRLSSFGDILASGNQSSTWSDATDGIPGPDNLPFASVRKEGAGFIVFIAGLVTADAWLEGCAHNTQWLVNVATFLSGSAQKDRHRAASPLKSEHTLFLSHATKDKVLVEAVYGLLKRQYSVGAWIDHEELIAGDSLPLQIEAAIRGASAFVLFWSSAAAQSQWVQRELPVALERADSPPLIVRLDETPVPESIGNLLRIESAGSDAGEIARQIFRVLELRRTRARIDEVRSRAAVAGDAGVAAVAAAAPAPSPTPAPGTTWTRSEIAKPVGRINPSGKLAEPRRVAEIQSDFRIDILSFLTRTNDARSGAASLHTLVSGSSTFDQKAIKSAIAQGLIDDFMRVNCQTGMDGHLDCHIAKGRYLLYGYEDVKVVDLKTHEVLATVACEDAASVNSAAWNPAGDRIAVGSTNYLTIADDRGGIVFHENMYSTRSGSPLSVSWQPSVNPIYTSGDNVVIANPAGQVLRELTDLGSSATAVAVSHCSRFIAASSMKGQVVIWSEMGDVLASLKGIASGGRRSSRCLTFSPDSRYLAQAGCFEGDGVLVVDLKEGKSAAIRQRHADLLAFHPTLPGLLLVVAEKKILFWQMP